MNGIGRFADPTLLISNGDNAGRPSAHAVYSM